MFAELWPMHRHSKRQPGSQDEINIRSLGPKAAFCGSFLSGTWGSAPVSSPCKVDSEERICSGYSPRPCPWVKWPAGAELLICCCNFFKRKRGGQDMLALLRDRSLEWRSDQTAGSTHPGAEGKTLMTPYLVIRECSPIHL